MSPNILLDIKSISFDSQANILYATLRQSLTIWTMPLCIWRIDAELVCTIDLVQLYVNDFEQARLLEDYTNTTRYTGCKAIAGPPKRRWFIRAQHDYYQPGDMLNLVDPFGCYSVWQLFVTFLCVLGAILFWPVTSIFEFYVCLFGRSRPSSLGTHLRPDGVWRPNRSAK
ncbi:hypothetical protein F4777DRAFT_579030 [Nemania sp. FL0916]|nr:hypothetical protein F4777DRAFT_579030 [Nemania sp. FL0916]